MLRSTFNFVFEVRLGLAHGNGVVFYYHQRNTSQHLFEQFRSNFLASTSWRTDATHLPHDIFDPGDLKCRSARHSDGVVARRGTSRVDEFSPARLAPGASMREGSVVRYRTPG
jgi:hypothetical protein